MLVGSLSYLTFYGFSGLVALRKSLSVIMELEFDMNHFYDFCVPLYSLLLTKYRRCIQAVDLECEQAGHRVLQLSKWDASDSVNLLQIRPEDL